MAVSAGSAYLDIAPRLQRTFSQNLTRQMFGPAGQAAERTGREAGQRFGKRFTEGTRQGTRPAVGVFRQLRGEMSDALGGRVAAAFGGAVIAAGLNKTVQAASALNETVSKTRVVFGPAAREVERFADTAATSLGMSRQEAMEAAATIGNLFVSMKIGRPAAAQMSTQMVRLAGDLASFNNASPEEALEALRSGLVGETEPLRRFGINLSDAALKAEAMRLGLGKVGPTLTASQRAQAAYSLILKQSKTAQGDFARTSGGLANQQRILAAEFKDAQAALGEQLLPAMLTGVRFANRLLDGFAKLNQATGGLAAQGLLAAGGLTAVGIGVAKVAGYVQGARGAWVAYRTATLGAAAADAVLTRQQILLGLSTTTAGNAAQTAGAKFALFGKLGVASLGAFAAAAAAGAYQGSQLAKAATEGTRVSGPFAEVRAKILRGLGLEATATKDLTGEQKAANAATAGGKQAGDAYAQALAAVSGGQADTSAKTAELKGKLQELREGFRSQVQSVRESIQSYQGLTTQSDVTTAQVLGDIRNQVSNFKTYSRDVRRLIKAGVSPAAIQELSQKGPQYVHALATGSNRELQTYKRYWRDRQREVRGSFAESMQRQFENLVAKMRAMQREINKLKGKTVDVKARTAVEIAASTRMYLRAANVPGFHAKGTRVPGYGGGDIYPAMLEPGEAVVPKEKVARPEFRSWARAQGIPGFQRGGVVGDFDVNLGRWDAKVATATARMGQRFADRLAASISRGLGKAIERGVGALGGGSGPGGWRWQMAALRRVFPGLQLISGFRPGAITATGNRSYHASGRAVDIPPRMDVFNWIRANYGARTKELIFSPAGGRQVWNGRPHVYSGITRANHWDHVHWAYDKGGWLMPGTTVATNNTGKPERVLPPGPVIGRREARMIAEELAAALQASPLAVYLDGQRVDRRLANARQWNARRG